MQELISGIRSACGDRTAAKEQNLLVRMMGLETCKLCRKNLLTSICVHSDPIHGAWFQLHSSPLFKDWFDSIPNLSFQVVTSSSESTCFNIYHVSWRVPVINVGVAFGPILLFSPFIIFLPIISQHIEYLLRCSDFLESSIGVVLCVKRNKCTKLLCVNISLEHKWTLYDGVK